LTYAIGIVAHVARGEQAHQLMSDVGAAFCAIDNGNLGCSGNHRKVWRHLAKRFAAHADYLVVLEDDAIPCDDFPQQLEQALSATTAPIVSLYLGRLRPPHLQYMIEPATARADAADASFILSRHLLHAVGLAVRADLVPDMLGELDEELPIDEAIHGWANKHRYRIAYTWPSICDHADGETLLQHRDGQQREPGRIAWKHGGRDKWTHQFIEMN
jgi:GR25 family glycosyltransferase involved in LPS biosynthesis